MYTIGRLARRARVNADSIRFYERQGLLAPATKTDSGYRLYDEEQLEEFAGAPETPDLTEEELARIEELYESNFGLEPARR